jgi:hypothetical protein
MMVASRRGVVANSVLLGGHLSKEPHGSTRGETWSYAASTGIWRFELPSEHVIGIENPASTYLRIKL